MPAERFFTPSPLKTNQSIEVKESEFHHLVRVMRTQVGDSVEIVNGQGALAQGKVKAISKRYAEITLQETYQAPPPQKEVILAQALPRPQKLDDIIEKGTELGVTEFWLFPGKLSDRKQISESQEKRLAAITISALKQCGRLWLPSIRICDPLEKWSLLEGYFYFGDLTDQAPWFHQVYKEREKNGFFIGPESGFHPDEIVKLKEFGVEGVKLNRNILRTETAAIIAIGLLSHLNFQNNIF